MGTPGTPRPLSGLQEAFGGWRQAVVHVVDWPPRRRQGSALCGRHVEHPALYPVGTAQEPRVRAPRCATCFRRLEERRRTHFAAGDELAARRRRT